MYGLESAGEENALATREAEVAATGVAVVAPGLATARGVKPEHARRLTYTRRAVGLVGWYAPDIEAVRAVVTATNAGRERTVAVHAHDVRRFTGISTTDVEHELESTLVDRGFSVGLDGPDHELQICFSENARLVGWTTVEVARDFADRKSADRPFFQSGSMAPVDARAFVNMVGAEPDTRILDPVCGTGSVPLEAGFIGANVVGVDAQAKMVGGVRENLCHCVGSSDVVHGDTTALPLRNDSMGGAVSDVLYDRQSKIARHSLVDLVGGALAGVRRAAPEYVMVADRSWAEAAEDAGWGVGRMSERRVHRSLVWYVYLPHW